MGVGHPWCLQPAHRVPAVAIRHQQEWTLPAKLQIWARAHPPLSLQGGELRAGGLMVRIWALQSGLDPLIVHEALHAMSVRVPASQTLQHPAHGDGVTAALQLLPPQLGVVQTGVSVAAAATQQAELPLPSMHHPVTE